MDPGPNEWAQGPGPTGPNESPAARPRPPGAFSVISHEKWHLGHFLFRRSFFDSILELCRTRRKRLYALQEINPRWLQMKKCLFRKTWGWGQQLYVKGRFLVVKVQFLKNVWKKEDQCTSIFHFVDRPELPYEVDFWRNSFPKKQNGFHKMWRFWKVMLDVSKEISASL